MADEVNTTNESADSVAAEESRTSDLEHIRSLMDDSGGEATETANDIPPTDVGDDAAGAEEKKAPAKKEAEAPPQEEPPGWTGSPSALAKARKYGIPDAWLHTFEKTNPGQADAILDAIVRGMTTPQEAEKAAADKAVEEKQEITPIDLGIDPDALDEDTRQKLGAAINSLQAQMIERVHRVEQRLAEADRQAVMAQTQREEQRFEGIIENMGPAYAELYGTGPYDRLAPNSAALAARVQVFTRMKQFNGGILPENPAELRRLFSSAQEFLFGDRLEAIRRKAYADDINDLTDTTTDTSSEADTRRPVTAAQKRKRDLDHIASLMTR